MLLSLILPLSLLTFSISLFLPPLLPSSSLFSCFSPLYFLFLYSHTFHGYFYSLFYTFHLSSHASPPFTSRFSILCLFLLPLLPSSPFFSCFSPVYVLFLSSHTFHFSISTSPSTLPLSCLSSPARLSSHSFPSPLFLSPPLIFAPPSLSPLSRFLPSSFLRLRSVPPYFLLFILRSCPVFSAPPLPPRAREDASQH